VKNSRVLLFLLVGLVAVGAFLAIDSSGVLAQDENNCLSCHGDPEKTKVLGNGIQVSLYVDESGVVSGAHRYIDCTTCHTATPHAGESPLSKLSLAEKCGSCHQYQYKLHLESIHGRQLAVGNEDVATCVDCHSPTGNPHSVMRVLEPVAPAYKKNIARTCARCHNNTELMADYGIVERVYESYMRSFHGKAIQLSGPELNQLGQATCTNCHGVHDIKSSADPGSPVAGLENLTVTCEQCHAGAGVEFASGFLGHREASRDNIPAAHYAEILFSTLLITVVSFGVVVVVGAAVRFSTNRWKE
jgi:hypothetical protein